MKQGEVQEGQMNPTAQVSATHGLVHIPEPDDPGELVPAVCGECACAKPWVDDKGVDAQDHLDYP